MPPDPFDGDEPPKLAFLDGEAAPNAAPADDSAFAPPVAAPARPISVAESAAVPAAPREIALPAPRNAPAPPEARGAVAMRTLAAGAAPLGNALAFLIALALAPLPEPWRRKIAAAVDLPFGSAGIGSGVIETGLAITVGAYAFRAWQDRVLAEGMATIGKMATDSDTMPGEGGMMAMGATAFIVFLLTPVGLAMMFFFAEGIVRATAAGVAGETVPSFPLWLIELARSAIAGRVAERRLGPRVPDEITRDGDGLTIAACRDRHWHRHTTIRWEGHLYKVERQRELPAGDAVRRHVYQLVAHPDREVVRRVTPYAPDDLVPKKK